MSSTYSSTPRCQRCGAALALNDARCANCGFLHTPGPVGNNTRQPIRNVDQQDYSSQIRPTPPQEGGLLKRFAPPNEQRNHYTPYSSFPAVPNRQAAQPSTPSSTPSQPMPPAASPQNTSFSSPPPQTQVPGNDNKYTRLSGQLLNNYDSRQSSFSAPSAPLSPMAPSQPLQPLYPSQPLQPPYSSQPLHPMQSPQSPLNVPVSPSYPQGQGYNQQQPIPFKARASAQYRIPPVNTTRPNAISQQAEKRSTRSVGRVLIILVLLLLLIGGSSLAYIYLTSRHTSQAQTATGTSTTQAKQTVTPQGTPIFQDQFTSNTNNWSIQSYPGEFAVSLGSGALQLESDNNKLLWELLPGTQKYDNFQLSVDAVLSKGAQNNGYGVYFRSSLDQNSSITTFYRFELYGDGSFAVFKGLVDANGVSTTPRIVDYTNNSAIQKQGSVNHITIDANGSELKFLVNGQIVSDIKDTTYTTGSIALFVSNLQNSPPGAVATFSHLVIYPAQK